MTDGYEFWRDALDGHIGPVYENAPQPGFYRLRAAESSGKRGAAKFVGAKDVAIWETLSGIMVAVDGLVCTDEDVWVSVCKWPVSEEDYRSHRATGIWPDVAAMEKK